MTRQALSRVAVCTALAVSWLAAVPRVSQSQTLGSFPFGHESDSHVGLFAYYPDLTHWANPDPNNPPPIAQIFCDQIPSPRGWIVFYVHQWKPTGGEFPTDTSALRWQQLQNALDYVRTQLGLVPIVRLHWLDNTAGSVEGWPYPDIVPPGQHWSVPVDTQTYDALRGANPEDKEYQDVAAMMRNGYVNWCTALARSLRNECRWFIIGNEINHPAEYGNTGIVPPYWYGSLWADCLAGMARDANQTGGPTKCQALVAALTPHAPTAGQPWQDKLADYARAVDLAYKAKFGGTIGISWLLPGFAIHGYPSAPKIPPGGSGLPVIYYGRQFQDYIYTVENTVHEGHYPIPTIASGCPTEYVIDEYNAWDEDADGETSYPNGSITAILDSVDDLRSNVAPNRLRAACYYAYRVPHYGSDPWYDLVVQENNQWVPNEERNLAAAFNELVAYTGCAPPPPPPPEPEWHATNWLVHPETATLVGDKDNVLDGNLATYAAGRLAQGVSGFSGPEFEIRTATTNWQDRLVEEIRVTIHVDRPVTGAEVTITSNNGWSIDFSNQTLTDGMVFSTALYTPGLCSQIWVTVDCKYAGNALRNAIGVAEIEIIGPG